MTSKIAIFASGSGSNAENIIQYFKDSAIFEFPVIISNKTEAFVHTRAARLGIPTATFNKEQFNDGKTVLHYLQDNHIDFIVLAGFLLKIPEEITQSFPNRIINIHPALLPKFGGKGMYGSKVHEAVKSAGETESGITIHYINQNYDEGNIIFQAKCPLTANDTAEDIAQKVHALEYEFYPQIIEKTFLHDLNNR